MASSNNATDLLLWQSLDKELLSMVECGQDQLQPVPSHKRFIWQLLIHGSRSVPQVETFGNLIKASTVLDEEVDPVTHGSSRERKAPGDLLEVS
jgi:hypothetical protein